MAERLKRMYRHMRGFLSGGLGEYPDKIGGYHGCSMRQRSSSLKLQGRCVKLPAITAVINQAMMEKVTAPHIYQGGRR